MNYITIVIILQDNNNFLNNKHTFISTKLKDRVIICTCSLSHVMIT